MPSLIQVLCSASALLAGANGQGVIQFAQGTKGSPASLPLGIDLSTNDAAIMRQSEIVQNVVNECGRSLLNGNIDSGELSEVALTNNSITQVTKGSVVQVAINMVDERGAGPYKCDVDFKSNAAGATGQVNATVVEAAPVNGVISLAVTLPKTLACIGGKSYTRFK